MNKECAKQKGLTNLIYAALVSTMTQATGGCVADHSFSRTRCEDTSEHRLNSDYAISFLRRIAFNFVQMFVTILNDGMLFALSIKREKGLPARV